MVTDPKDPRIVKLVETLIEDIRRYFNEDKNSLIPSAETGNIKLSASPPTTHEMV